MGPRGRYRWPSIQNRGAQGSWHPQSCSPACSGRAPGFPWAGFENEIEVSNHQETVILHKETSGAGMHGSTAPGEGGGDQLRSRLLCSEGRVGREWEPWGL